MPRRRRRRDKGPWFWRGAILTMMSSVFALFATAAMMRPPALDADTNCRLDRQDPAHTVLLIDQSDPFASNDLGWVEDLVEAEARSLPRHGRLTLILPDAERPHEPVEAWSACTPGSAADANPLFQNPAMIEAAWTESFHAPFKARVKAALTDKSAPASPLMETLYAVADRADFAPSKKNRRIVIVSDLMQHSGDFSFYRAGADWTAFLETDLSTEVPRMEGIDVAARIVPRQEYDLPLIEVRAFWRNWFDEAGAEFGTVN